MGPDSEKYFGIDLGTTNSCIAVIEGGKAKVIEIDGEATTPSVLAYREGEWLIGRKARNHMKVAPDQAVSSIKRKMDDLDYRADLAGHKLSPIEISAKILEGLTKQAGNQLGCPIKKVVITVPAWFKEGQRQATLAAGKLAGLEVLQIANEPTAAAIAHESKHLEEGLEEKWVVYDLGGGTFDVSVLNVTANTHEVLSSVGNTFLGGDDFDRRLAERFQTLVKDRHNLDPTRDPIVTARLRHLAEQVKIALSDKTEFTVSEPLVLEGKTVMLEDTVTRREFEDMIADLIESTHEKLSEALSQAQLEASRVSRLLMVGGSTRIPMVAERLKERFGLDGENWVDPDLSVALGAAFQSAIRSGGFFERDVVDICPHSLGIAAIGHEDEMLGLPQPGRHPRTFAPLIRRNSRLPAVASKSFYKVHPEQDMVNIVVYQGESSNNEANTLVGEFTVQLENSDDVKIDVSFHYDHSGIIQIKVDEPGQKNPKSYSMDLSKSIESNSDLAKGLSWDDEAFDEEDDLLGEKDNEATNFLIEKIAARLKIEPNPEVADKLSRYKVAMNAGEDDDLDDLEADLYDWLEQNEADQ